MYKSGDWESTILTYTTTAVQSNSLDIKMNNAKKCVRWGERNDWRITVAIMWNRA